MLLMISSFSLSVLLKYCLSNFCRSVFVLLPQILISLWKMIFFQIFYKQQGMVGLFSDSWPTELLTRCIGIAILFLIYKLVNHNAHVRESPHTNAFDGCSSVNCIRCNGRIQDDNIKVIVDELNKENHSGLERAHVGLEFQPPFSHWALGFPTILYPWSQL